MSLRKGPFSAFTIYKARSQNRHASGTPTPRSPVGSEASQREEHSDRHAALQGDIPPDAMSLATCYRSEASTSTELWQTAQTTTYGMAHLPIQHLRSSLSEDFDADMLMHHYAVNVADVIQPIGHLHNTYRDLYVPTALQGVHMTMSDSTNNETSAHSALFHALLASAAFHLWNCNRAQTTFWRMGNQHRTQALHLLQSAVDAPDPGIHYRSLMMSMLALITIGVSVNELPRRFPIRLTFPTVDVRRSRGFCRTSTWCRAITKLAETLENSRWCDTPAPRNQRFSHSLGSHPVIPE